MKKLLFFGLFVAVLMPVAHASADGFTALAPIPGLTSQSMIINSDSLAAFFNNLYKYLVGLAATIAVIQIMWAGAGIAFFHKDAVAAITDDKGKIYNAIFGLVLVLSPVLVFSIINPSILNLSLNMPPIKPAAANSKSSQSSQSSQTITDCSTQPVGTPCTTGTITGTCQLMYDMSSLTCQAVAPSTSPGQTTGLELPF